MLGFLDRIIGLREDSRTSTKYSMRAGWFLFVVVTILIFLSLHIGLITPDNLMSVINALLITAASLFGINLGRITAENVKQKDVEKERERNKRQKEESES